MRVLVEPLCLFHPTLGYGFVGWVKRSGPTAVLTSNGFTPFMRVLVEPLCLFHPTWGYGSVGWVKRSGPTAVCYRRPDAFGPQERHRKRVTAERCHEGKANIGST